MMEKIIKIEGAQAFIRTGGGSYREVDMYHRGEEIFLKFGAGYIKVCPGLDNRWTTSNPKVQVVDYTREVFGITMEKGWPRYKGLHL